MSSAGLFEQIVVQGFGGLLANLLTKYVSNESRSIKKDVNEIRQSLDAHLEATFIKCTKVKTILNGDKTADTLSIYVDQNFKFDGQEIDQYEFIDHIRDGNSTIIQGVGGGGKSMFIRYLWLSYFEKSDGKIPLLIELRNLNKFSHDSMEDFIFYSIVKIGTKVTQGEVNGGLSRGEFVIFLDGFDEVNFDRRERI